MLSDEDIKKIIEANREVFPSKEDFENFKQELKQRWIKQLAEKLGVKLEY